MLYKQRRVKTVWMIKIRRGAFFQGSVSLICHDEIERAKLDETIVREENASLLPLSPRLLTLIVAVMNKIRDILFTSKLFK